jgi:hypothetical protein
MKKTYRYLMIGVLLVGVACVVYSVVNHQRRETGDNEAFSNVSNRLVQIGPYAKNINLTENVGAYSLNISAERLFVRKGKFLGFNTALKKTFVADRLCLRLYKSGIKKLEAYKDRVILDSFMKTIKIDNPRILYPSDMEQPKEIRLEKDKKMLTIHSKDKVVVWDLSK